MNKKPEELIDYERNNKTHNEKQIDLLAKSIKEYGMNSPIIIDSKNVIIAGHGRNEACKKIGLELVPVENEEIINNFKNFKRYNPN